MSERPIKDILRENLLPLFMVCFGLSLLYFGTEEYKIFREGLAEYTRTSPENRTIWIIIIGAASTVGGIIGLVREKVV